MYMYVKFGVLSYIVGWTVKIQI